MFGEVSCQVELWVNLYLKGRMTARELLEEVKAYEEYLFESDWALVRSVIEC